MASKLTIKIPERRNQSFDFIIHYKPLDLISITGYQGSALLKCWETCYRIARKLCKSCMWIRCFKRPKNIVARR